MAEALIAMGILAAIFIGLIAYYVHIGGGWR